MGTTSTTVITLDDLRKHQVTAPPLPEGHRAIVLCFGCGRSSRHLDNELCRDCHPAYT